MPPKAPPSRSQNVRGSIRIRLVKEEKPYNELSTFNGILGSVKVRHDGLEVVPYPFNDDQSRESKSTAARGRSISGEVVHKVLQRGARQRATRQRAARQWALRLRSYHTAVIALSSGLVFREPLRLDEQKGNPVELTNIFSYPMIRLYVTHVHANHLLSSLTVRIRPIENAQVYATPNIDRFPEGTNGPSWHLKPTSLVT
ncbi:hypothetical protein PM082_012292 [Marasmius tenuissimus]|nr:hypothetical protein PM082_012292 [Marasmius tenuissimus]